MQAEILAVICAALIVLVIFWPDKWNYHRPKNFRVVDSVTGTPIEETTPGRLYEQITRECPACRKSPLWRMGPQGGMMQNIECDHCGARFNVAPFGWAEKL